MKHAGKYTGQGCLAVAAVFVCGFVVLMPAPAQAAGLGWEQLGDNQRSVLQLYQQQWSGLSANTRQILVRWADLPEAERLKIQERHKQWSALSASRQATIMGKLEHYKRMSEDKRRKIKAWRDWVRSLPSQEQEALHQQWPNMDAGQRKQYIQRLEQKYGKH